MKFFSGIIVKTGVFFLLIPILIHCNYRRRGKVDTIIFEGGQLARKYCSTCHVYTPPTLLDKDTWQYEIMPYMGRRMGMDHHSIFYYPNLDPRLQPDQPMMEQEDWEKIVAFFVERSPEKLPPQILLKIPQLNPDIFKARSFTSEISGNSIVTLLKIDQDLGQVIIGDGSSSNLYIFDMGGHQLDQIPLSSPVTDVNVHQGIYDLTLTGILHPNNLNRGSIARISRSADSGAPAFTTLIDSLYRPVRCLVRDFTGDGNMDYLVCEYGNDIGRLAFYRGLENGNYQRRIIEAIPGSIALDVHDFNGDGLEDIMVLYAQGDERIVIYYNQGDGNFNSTPQIIRRFPSVYGSMFMKLYDFNGDGYMDILYVNGDNFDHSQILKPYHGIRIFENDGENRFERKYFYPVYGAAKALAHDFDLDGDLDLIVAANFADLKNNPERGIMYFECTGPYAYEPYAIEASRENQWNTMDIGDIDQDGDDDVIIGAMYLQNVLKIQKVESSHDLEQKKSSLILLENQLYP